VIKAYPFRQPPQKLSTEPQTGHAGIDGIAARCRASLRAPGQGGQHAFWRDHKGPHSTTCPRKRIHAIPAQTNDRKDMLGLPEHVMEWHNGDKDYSPFSDAEMTTPPAGRAPLDGGQRCRCGAVHVAIIASTTIPAGSTALSVANTAWSSPRTMATTISAGIDGGQPWRRSFGGNVTYTDWRRDNFYRAVRQLTPGVKRLGIEFDHVNLDYRMALKARFAGGGVRRYRATFDVDAVDQVGRGTRADPNRRAHLRRRRGGVRQGGQGGRAGT
jgi:hypothetical protein